MSLGQLLIDRELVTEAQVEQASRRLRVAGGSLAESLMALDFVSRELLEGVLEEPPLAPKTVDDLGLEEQFLLNYILRLLYVTGVETVPETAEYSKLPGQIVLELFEQIQKRRMLEVLGPSKLHPSILRYSLSDLGRERAMESMLQCGYTGPVPVRLAEYRIQVAKQALAHERSTPTDLRESFSDLVLPGELLDNLGPAINSGKAVLLYGGAGNGKTSVAEGIGRSFRQDVYLPHAIEVDGQIIRFYDPAVHQPVEEEESGEASLLRVEQEVDARWVRCRRPIIMTGGELTIEMLDLSFDEIAKFYEAPAHIKATGGVFIIDDFGRQRCGTMELLNRWILPLERRIDYMTLHTGMKLELPFDQMVVFSTNFPPRELMDDAALRRINYKVHVAPPTKEDFAEIYRRVVQAHGLTPFPDVLAYLMEDFYPRTGLAPAGFHPKFIVEHVVARCHFESVPPRLTKDRVEEAVQNLVVEDGSTFTPMVKGISSSG